MVDHAMEWGDLSFSSPSVDRHAGGSAIPHVDLQHAAQQTTERALYIQAALYPALMNDLIASAFRAAFQSHAALSPPLFPGPQRSTASSTTCTLYRLFSIQNGYAVRPRRRMARKPLVACGAQLTP